MVRNFPSAPQSRSGRTVVALLIALMLACVSASVMPGASADDLRHKQKSVNRAVKHAATEVDESSAALSKARHRLQLARTKLGAAQRTLGVTQSKLAAARAKDAQMLAALQGATAKLAKTRAELAVAKKQVVAQRDAMASVVAQNYQQGNPQLLGLVAMLTSGSPSDITSQVNTMHNLMNQQAGMLDDLRATEARMARLEKQVQENREKVEAQKAATAKVVAIRTTLEKRAASDRTKVAGLVVSSRAAESDAAQILAADKATLRKLEREESRIKTLILKRARKSNKPGFTGDAGGFLMRPVPGVVTSPYGYRRHPIYGYWGLHNGTDFRTPCGQSMVAVASGTVISRYWSDVYGNRLVVDLGRVNGKSLTVIYNHASSYRVGVGSRVSRGQVVGNAGNTGWSTACHLHFIAMVNGNTADPMRFF